MDNMDNMSIDCIQFSDNLSDIKFCRIDIGVIFFFVRGQSSNEIPKKSYIHLVNNCDTILP